MFAKHIMPRRVWKRYSFEIFFFAFVLVSGFLVGKAFASEPKDTKFLNQKAEQYIVAHPATTTTTTTLPPIKQKVVMPAIVAVQRQVALPSGSHTDWMAQAGIPESEWGYVDYIISHESGWEPSRVNSTGCIGLIQACPSGLKPSMLVACPNWQIDPVCQINRADTYASKYGGWLGSYNFWISNHWW